jgi:PncC family amidohydrolase
VQLEQFQKYLQTALEMVKGVIRNSNADIGVSITGIAGPTGDTKNKPVGTVCFGFCISGECATIRKHFLIHYHLIATLTDVLLHQNPTDDFLRYH